MLLAWRCARWRIMWSCEITPSYKEGRWGIGSNCVLASHCDLPTNAADSRTQRVSPTVRTNGRRWAFRTEVLHMFRETHETNPASPWSGLRSNDERTSCEQTPCRASSARVIRSNGRLRPQSAHIRQEQERRNSCDRAGI